mgnify:CR=1 FL=1
MVSKFVSIALFQALCVLLLGLGAAVVIGPAASEALDGAVPCRSLPPIRVRGRREAVAVHVIDESRLTDEAIETLRTAILREEGERDEDA